MRCACYTRRLANTPGAVQSQSGYIQPNYNNGCTMRMAEVSKEVLAAIPLRRGRKFIGYPGHGIQLVARMS